MNAPVAPVLFAVEPFADVYGEAAELMKLHWDEVAPYKDLLTINLDLSLYGQFERDGKLVTIAARHGAVLVGYIVMMLHRHHHYAHAMVATEDVHFLHRDFRKGTTGLRLIMVAEAEMVRRGIHIMTLRTKVEHNHGLLFERLGYAAQDIVYTKRLGG